MTQAEKNDASPSPTSPKARASVSFQELRVVFKNMTSLYAADKHDIALPDIFLSEFQPMAYWLSRAYVQCGKHALGNAKMVLYHANNHFEGHEASDFEIEAVSKLRQGLIEGETALNYLCKDADCSLQLYELDPDHATMHKAHTTSAKQAIMSVEDASMAITYGMMSVEQQTECLLGHAFGLNTEMVAQQMITALKRDEALSGFEALTIFGSREIAALCGALIAARLSGIPAIISGSIGLACMMILQRETPRSISHCLWCPSETQIAFFDSQSDDWPCYAVSSALVKQVVGADILNAYSDLKLIASLIKADAKDILV